MSITSQNPGSTDNLHRVHNFNAGPAALPLPVLEQAQAELLDYRGTGMSILEMSHRSSAFEGLMQETEQDLRDLLGLTGEYKVLFQQGGASMQFGMVQMNLRPAGTSADYTVNGTWGRAALKDAQKLGATRIAGSSEATHAGPPLEVLLLHRHLEMAPGKPLLHRPLHARLQSRQALRQAAARLQESVVDGLHLHGVDPTPAVRLSPAKAGHALPRVRSAAARTTSQLPRKKAHSTLMGLLFNVKYLDKCRLVPYRRPAVKTAKEGDVRADLRIRVRIVRRAIRTHAKIQRQTREEVPQVRWGGPQGALRARVPLQGVGVVCDRLRQPGTQEGGLRPGAHAPLARLHLALLAAAALLLAAQAAFWNLLGAALE